MTENVDNHTIVPIMQGGVIGSLTLVEDEDHNVRAPKTVPLDRHLRHQDSYAVYSERCKRLGRASKQEMTREAVRL